MNIVIDLIRREVCNYWRFPGDGRQDTDSTLSYSYLSSERKKYTGLIFFFSPITWFYWCLISLKLITLLAQVTFLFSIIAANFFRYKGKIMLAVCSWKKPWHRSCRNQGEKLLAISKPVADWLRFFLPWPFLINGRICSVVEKPVSWAQSVLAPECGQLHSRPLPGLCFWFHPQRLRHWGWELGEQRGGKSSQINLDISADNRSTTVSNQNPFTHIGHRVPCRSMLFSSM